MSEHNALIGQLMRGPIIPQGSHDLDLELLAHQLEGLVRWIRAKQQQGSNMYAYPDQGWTGNFGVRNFRDPMQAWIAGIGEAQV